MENLRLLVFLSILVAASGQASAESDTFRVERGSEIALDNYVLEFRSATVTGKNSVLEFYERRDKAADEIIFKTYLGEIYDGERTYRSFRHGFNMTVNRVGWDGDEQYVNVTIETDRDIFYSSNLRSDSPKRVIAAREDTLNFDLTLENSGTKNQSFKLGAKAPESVSVKFSYMGFNVSGVEVPAGETRSIEASVEVGEEASIGEKNLTFIASGRKNVSESFDLEIRGLEQKRSMRVTLEDRTETARPGDTVRMHLEIENDGEAPLKDMEVKVTSPEGWNVDTYGHRVRGEFSARERTGYSYRIEVPENAESGDYYVEAKVKTANLESETKKMRVNVSSSSGLSWIGIALMVVSLSGMVTVYWRLGRR